MDDDLKNKIKDALMILTMRQIQGCLTIDESYNLGLLEGILLLRDADNKQMISQVDYILENAKRAISNGP